MSSAVTDLDWEHELCRANSGAIRFHVRSLSRFAKLSLCADTYPYKELFIITLGEMSRIIDLLHEDLDSRGNREGVAITTQFISRELQEFWLSWFNQEIRLGVVDLSHLSPPFISYKYQKRTEVIGYIRFEKTLSSNQSIDWIYESSPILSNPIQHKSLNSDELRWVSLTDHRLPRDALIGGFEHEPTYIARAVHNGSICPGKYVPSKRLAFVPWGRREHSKTTFEILCGHNAVWVETKTCTPPPNAFIGGVSEVQSEPLYIGRAVHDGNLITGKIHVLYRTCYLPYNGKEVEVNSYEILVLPDVTVRSICSNVENEI